MGGRLEGRTAVVTGGSRGIGAAVATRLAAEGAAVVIGYQRAVEAAEEVTARLKGQGAQALAVCADVGDPEQIGELADRAVETFGGLDVLASCAGIEHFGRLEELTAAEFDRVFAVNTRGQLFAAQQAARHMAPGGRIILTSSVSVHRAVFGHTLYAASKGAVEAMVLSLAAELGPRRITVNAVSPGGTATDMAVEYGHHYRHPELRIPDEEWLRASSALQRVGRPEEIAALYAFLATEDASYITGRVLPVDGGLF
ncbi:glucose 1-dehydrogenase [Streptomyces misionensis]|uniref:Glucose 1-dehydrogenase n=1 Tax=Streptomyces misionensis TaxID=67331 RepID=A0A5C6K6V4_9ACTN|nr:glucose 1-dehydrogenase [Streptomyces misionensis]TWV57418.1 glucose 1-dehydrogenase [Streptomyces misionensis]